MNYGIKEIITFLKRTKKNNLYDKKFSNIWLYKRFKQDLEKILKLKRTGLHEPSLINQILKKWANVLNHHSYQLTHVSKFEESLKNLLNQNMLLPQILELLHIYCFEISYKEGYNVILPTLSFVATGNAVIYNDAIPVFIDLEFSFRWKN